LQYGILTCLVHQEAEMNMGRRKRASLIVAAAIVASCSATYASGSNIPTAAWQIAETELDNLKGSPSLPVFDLYDLSPLRDAHLGEPFEYYWATVSFLDFDGAPEDLLQHLDGFCICFPVVSGDHTFGTINVRVGPNGQYLLGGRIVGDKLVKAVETVRAAVADKERDFVTPVNIWCVGNFVVVGDGPLARKAVAIDESAASVTSTALMGDVVQLVPIDKVVVPLKRALREYKKRAEALEHETEELQQLDD
jgi:hypothetical protein